MKKEVQVLMMPNLKKGKDATGLVKCIKDWKSFITPEEDFNKVGDVGIGVNTSMEVLEYWKPQHLYFISNDEIKEGDWCFDISIEKIFQAKEGHLKIIKVAKHIGVGVRKVVASTDKSLEISSTGYTEDRARTFYSKLPIIPQSFIEKFGESNGKIENVMLEYKCDWCYPNDGSISCKNILYKGNEGCIKVLEVNRNNEVIISKQ